MVNTLNPKPPLNPVGPATGPGDLLGCFFTVFNIFYYVLLFKTGQKYLRTSKRSEYGVYEAKNPPCGRLDCEPNFAISGPKMVSPTLI